MKISRDTAFYINYALQNVFPPFIRDTKWFIWPLFKVAYGKHAQMMYDFKSQAYAMSDEQMGECYRISEDWSIHGETDLNTPCIKAILENVVGETVVDVGCGRGFLAGQLCLKHKTIGVDVNINKGVREKYPYVDFVSGFVESLPFPDRSFDSVVCTHTLEHTRNIMAAISELRRIARKRVIVVVPMERPYRYTFNLHLHFFPYLHSFLILVGKRPKQHCVRLSGDLFYYEDKEG